MYISTENYVEEKLLSQHFPKVSVVIATYRREESLKKALESLTSQTYSNFEVIVVDDNDDIKWNEKVGNVINYMKCNNEIEIFLIKNKANYGSAETRNIGIERTVGEYVTFLDDDDIYLPDKLKRQVEHMIKEGSDFSLTDLWLYNEKGNLIEKRKRDYIKDFSLDSLRRYHLMHHMTGTDVMMFKKEYLVDIGMFSRVNVGDEFYLMQKAIDGEGLFSYLPECDVKAYVHSESEGLSSGDGKIKGEKELFEYKKTYFDILNSQDKRYIKMRHYAVLAYAELRSKNYIPMLKNLLLSFSSSPYKFVALYKNRK